MSIGSTRGPNSVNIGIAAIRSVDILLGNLGLSGCPVVVCANTNTGGLLTLAITTLGNTNRSIGALHNIVNNSPVNRLMGANGARASLSTLCSRVTRAVGFTGTGAPRLHAIFVGDSTCASNNTRTIRRITCAFTATIRCMHRVRGHNIRLRSVTGSLCFYFGRNTGFFVRVTGLHSLHVV